MVCVVVSRVRESSVVVSVCYRGEERVSEVVQVSKKISSSELVQGIRSKDRGKKR